MSSSTPLRPPRLEVGQGADDELLMQMETEFTLNGGSSVNSNAHATAAGANGSGGGGGSADSGGGLDVAIMVEEHRVSPSNVSTRSQVRKEAVADIVVLGAANTALVAVAVAAAAGGGSGFFSLAK